MLDENEEEDIIEFTGENGKISLSCFTHGKLKLVQKGIAKYFDFQNPEHISQNLIQQVVEELRGNGKCISTGKSGARTSWVLDEVVKEYYT